MQNLNPTRIIARRGRDMMLVGALLLMGGLVVSGIGFLIWIILSSTLFGVLFVLLGLIGLLVGIGLVIRGLTYRKDNEVARVVGDLLSHELNERYVFIRNLSRGGLGYIDALLLGPAGALVFRVTDDPGIFLNEGSDWLERQNGRDFALSRKNFTRECVTDVSALRNYLARRGMSDIPVFGVVVFTNDRAEVQTRKPAVPVANMRTLMVVLRRDYLAVPERIIAEKVKSAVGAIYN